MRTLPERRLNVGPTEYFVIGFEGNHFSGEIMPELKSLCDNDLIRILDLLVVKRADDGEIDSLEMSDMPELHRQAPEIEGDMGQWFSQDDVEQIAEVIPPSSTVALLLVEYLWAKPLADAIVRANGTLLAQTHVPRELMDEVETLIGTGTRNDISRIVPDDISNYRRAA
jgi:hypothetical protein